MSDSSFWKERQAAFLTYADRFKYLTAIWGARSNSYELWWRDYPEVPSDIESVFNALAGVATAGLPESDRMGEGQPWEIWLEFMRKSKFSHDLERDRAYAGRRPGEIENLFQVSADFCEVLAARAVKSDAVGRTPPKGASEENRPSEQDALDATEQQDRPPGKNTNRRHGPKPDYETASRIAAIVDRLAPDGLWRPKLLEICEALDEAKLPPPKKWLQDVPRCLFWSAQPDQQKTIKVVEYRLKTAKKAVSGNIS